MTPFDTWYSEKIAPTIPTDAPEIVKKISREMMAGCWNAALDAVIEQANPRTSSTFTPHAFAEFISLQRARVTP